MSSTLFDMPDPTNPPERERSWQAGPVRVRVTLPCRGAAARAQGAADHRADRRHGDGPDGDQGYDAVSMRSLAKALDTGPASLYQHVANRDELDQLVIDRIASQLRASPRPTRSAGRTSSRTSSARCATSTGPTPARPAPRLAQIPTSEGTLRAAEGIMAICLAGGIVAAGRRLVLRPRRALRQRDRLRGVPVGPARELHEVRRGGRPRPARRRHGGVLREPAARRLPADVALHQRR